MRYGTMQDASLLAAASPFCHRDDDNGVTITRTHRVPYSIVHIGTC